VIRRIFEVHAAGTGSVGSARTLNAEGAPALRPKG